MVLPENKILPVPCLSQVFNNTTATYKFYWFVSLLEIVVRERKTTISFWEIIAGMVAESWYPIHYFNLSFGKLDSSYCQSMALQEELGIAIDSDKEKIKQTLLAHIDDPQVRGLLRIFTRNVPYRFLSPWITYTNDSDVVARSQKFENNCLYAIKGETIEVNPVWVDYLAEHYGILRDFAFRNLAVFLQKRNPKVQDIPSKLIKPETCPFCELSSNPDIIAESSSAVAFLDGYPVSEGHTLIIPRRHVANYFDLTESEQQELWQLVNHCKTILEERYHPDGFNVGINVNEAAGQSVFHAHIHLIPRYKGDVENPKGGVRGVIPGKQKY